MVDHLMGEASEMGSMKCGCHPNCGIGTILMVNKTTKQMVPLCDFLDVEEVAQGDHLDRKSTRLNSSH